MTNPWNLTKREFEVLALMLQCHGAVKIAADRLGISFKTADTFLGRAKRRMGAQTRFDALIEFDRWQRNGGAA